MTSIALENIRADDRCQPRATFDNELVSQYAEAMVHGDDFPAVTVFFDGLDYFLADGFHRYHAVKSLGLADIEATVKSGSLRDAILFSCGANASHGWRRTNDDKRRAVLRLLNDAEWSKWADREIARQCAVSPHTVASLRPKSIVTVQTHSEPQERVYNTRHGTVATMNTTPIGGVREPKVIEEVSILLSGTKLDTSEYRDTLKRLSPNDQVRAAKRDLKIGNHQPPEKPVRDSWQEQADPGSVSAIDEVNREGRLTNCIWEIVKGVDGLPDPKQAATRFPSMLLHTVEEAELLKVSAWFLAFAAEIKVRKEVPNVAA